MVRKLTLENICYEKVLFNEYLISLKITTGQTGPLTKMLPQKNNFLHGHFFSNRFVSLMKSLNIKL